MPDNLLAVAPRPGILLRPKRTYAFVVLRALADAAGAPLGVPSAFTRTAECIGPCGSSRKQLDQVKYQYGCFFESYQRTGTAVIRAPAALGTPWPGP